MTLPTDPKARKAVPMCTGLLDYFPDALAAVAELSVQGNVQHGVPGERCRWDRSKSGDEADALLRHLAERGRFDSDGKRHSVKVAWRALALLQKELEHELGLPVSRGSFFSDYLRGHSGGSGTTRGFVTPARHCRDCGISEGEFHGAYCLSGRGGRPV